MNNVVNGEDYYVSYPDVMLYISPVVALVQYNRIPLTAVSSPNKVRDWTFNWNPEALVLGGQISSFAQLPLS